ncbi:kinase-like domain-containing protein [Thermothelomyces heterothallicus CBS 202.75]|uniref:kinase-like domain-containing protein n=1 Tax=Thermothelomyces heterothallicus CBS 202.75 TaxID=1149848 RepID=UPI003741EAAA
MHAKEKDLEDGCFAVTFERKYYRRGGVFIKRNLRPKEYRIGYRGLHVPRLGKERLMNEAEALRYIRQNTDIPVPGVYCDFEDDEAYYLITEYVDGVDMSSLSEEQRAIVYEELSIHLAKLKTLRSNRMGGPSGIVIPPYRVMRQTETDDWRLQVSDRDEYVFCHNDLSQQNVIVDPDSLKIKAIIDWEYSGFYPAYFEMLFYTRLGPSVAIKDEIDDSADLLAFLKSRAEGA